jgi:hypothetical protein
MKLLSMLWVAGALAVAALAQQPPAKFPFNLDYLSKRATESVSVTLDKPLIDLALRFLPANDPDTAKVRQAVQGLTGIYVRSFEFDKEGAYQASEVESLRKQLIGQGWSKIVEVRGKDENVDVSIHQDGEKILGLVVISAEPTELTVVSITGSIRPEQLTDLEGFGGIPRISGIEKQKAAPKAEKEPPKETKKKDQEEH